MGNKLRRKTSKKKLESLILLRAVAVLMVTLCHFAYPLSEAHFFSGFFKMLDQYGKYGVHVFFVISGFVIPLSLYNGRYKLKFYLQFLLKRLYRLHPPYILALVVSLIIAFISYQIRNQDFPESFTDIFLAFFYFHIPVDNPVFWTLIVEAQYYILIGLLYPVFMRRWDLSLVLLLPGAIIAEISGIGEIIPLFSHLPIFLIGTYGFLFYIKHKSSLLNLLALFTLVLSIFFFIGEVDAVVSLLTIAVILLYGGAVPGFFRFTGKLSYSIYLIHFPIGVKLINLSTRIIGPEYYWLLILLGLFVTYLVSWLFYILIEEPSEAWSKSIKYKKARKEELVPSTA